MTTFIKAKLKKSDRLKIDKYVAAHRILQIIISEQKFGFIPLSKY